MKIFLFTFISIFYLAVGQNECLPTTCGPLAPVVRFPFWLKGHQPEHCGYPGFGLSCNESGRTDFDLQFPVTASTNNIVVPLKMTVAVWDIDYKAQKMLAGYARARSCLPRKLPTVNSSNTSASPFEAEAIGYGDGSTLFNCSNLRDYESISCLSSHGYQVIEFASVYDIASLPPYSSCFKMYNISFVPDRALAGRDDEYGSRFYLSWSRPSCGKCEAKGKYCRLQNSGAAEEIECFSPQHATGASKNHISLIAGITTGIIVMTFIMIASFLVLRVMKRKKDDKKRIENALKTHKDMRPRRYSYEDVKRLITNNVTEKLCHDTLHKGMLTDGTPVAVKVLHGSEQNVEDFISEVERIGRMQHTNILQLIGFSVDGSKRALIYEFLQGGTLDMLLYSENQNHRLGWEKLQQIALGIAKGIEYVYQESTQEILNLVASPQSILVDHNLYPKVLVATTSAAEGALQYIAPELLSSSSNIIPQKAYAYGFGMLLLDMVGRSANFSRGEKESNEVHFPECRIMENRVEGAIQLEEEGQENDLILIKKFSIVGLWCIQWFPSDRPSMKAVIEMLEQENMPSLPSNPFASFHLN
ncbi:hypothetical protein C2S53_013090 [Perilla frutescens var. hirtella]|uniref:Protein kinase domain-containing protein n=1 Tax=Perilla frutescens var. hirtella TaxID=608512 RepID=A0AAD4J6I0_PERFH|nr:hypothetical protein C2S53_013090 [Perilla frutescens var. hirtella]